jgi:hypothetical protein
VLQRLPQQRPAGIDLLTSTSTRGFNCKPSSAVLFRRKVISSPDPPLKYSQAATDSFRFAAAS